MYVIWMWRLEENWNVSFILSMCRGVDEYDSDRFCGKKRMWVCDNWISFVCRLYFFTSHSYNNEVEY